jgi:hypothetical protein
MGSFFSNSMDDNNDHNLHSDSESDDLFQNEIQDDELSEHYLVIILRQLIDR